ncbi:MAG: hypothetical protein RI580_16255 [Halothece sp. Uz-M2-17]|nr:hypothetical protein [Halothece sp. Uz-M2-17]
MVGIIKNLFGGKDNFYAELDDEQAPAKTEASQETQSKTEPAAATQVKEEAKLKTPQKQAETQAQSAQPTAPTPAPIQNSNQGSKNPLVGETFAPTYLIPKPTTPRRRPGVNMGQFIDMARDMQTPRNQ